MAITWLIASLIAIAIAIPLLTLIITVFHFKTSTKNLPPGSFGWPIIGETMAFHQAGLDGTPEAFVTERASRHGCAQVFKTSVLCERVAVLCGPAGNRFLFGNENKLVQVWWPSSARKLFGSCLLNAVGSEAKKVRKMLLSFLGPDVLTRLYIDTMDVATQQHIKAHWQGKEEVKVYQTIKLYTFELACRLFMSLEDPKHVSQLANQFYIFLKGAIQIPFNVPGTRLYRANKAAVAIRKQLGIIVKQRRVALEQKTASPSQDLLSHLLVSSDENGGFLSETEIVDNILMLLFAGHDTSSVAITLLMKNLGQFPQVYEKVLREQMDIASSKETGELLQWEDIQKMRYSWNVVSEVLRQSPPVSGAFREALVDFTYAGYTIPRGWKLYWSASSTQMDNDLYPNATNFDASRFEGEGPSRFAYVPFGGGPRTCVGKEFARLEILIFLHNVVKRFKWDLLVPDEKIIYDPMPAPEKGLPILLQPHKF